MLYAEARHLEHANTHCQQLPHCVNMSGGIHLSHNAEFGPSHSEPLSVSDEQLVVEFCLSGLNTTQSVPQ